MISNVPYETHLVALREIGDLQATITDLRSQLEADAKERWWFTAAIALWKQQLEAAERELTDAQDIARDEVRNTNQLHGELQAERTKREEAERIVDQFRRSGLGEEIRRADEAEQRLGEALAALKGAWSDRTAKANWDLARSVLFQPWARAVLASATDISTKQETGP